MATTVNKQKVLDFAFAALKKRYDVPDAVERTVLEHLLFAVVREGTTFEKADAAFAALKEQFVDWNEVRVSTVQELCDACGPLPDVTLRAQRLIGILQEWFELTYTFDMEEVAKKGLKEGARKVSRLHDVNDFTVAWLMQYGLSGHAIPLDAPSIRVLRRLAVLDSDADAVEAQRATVEHFVPKPKGAAMAELLSQHAHDLCVEVNPKCGRCPLLDECPYGQAHKGADSTKPRKPR